MFIILAIVNAVAALFFAGFGLMCLGNSLNRDKAFPLLGIGIAFAVNAIVFFKLTAKFQTIEDDLHSLNSQGKALDKNINEIRKTNADKDKKILKLQEELKELKERIPTQNEDSTKKDGE